MSEILNANSESKEKKPEVPISNSPLLRKLFNHGDGVEEFYELERRYTPARKLRTPEILELSRGKFLDMGQVYIRTIDEQGKKRRARLRWTSPGTADQTLRLAYKTKRLEHQRGQQEYQVKFPEGGSEEAEYDTLWLAHRYPPIYKRRYYFPYTFERPLPDGSSKQCKAEIHYDIYKGPPKELDGYVRIEIEFDDDDDEMFARDNKKVLPDWVGEDVTDDRRYKTRQMAKTGKRPENQEPQSAEDDEAD